MLIKIAFFTTCRGDMSILTPLIKKMYRDKKFKVMLFVGGTHMADEHGKTINEIKSNKLKITDTFDYLLNEDSSLSLTLSNSIAEIKIAYIFQKYDFDYVCIIGDRFERIAMIINSILNNKPIIHIHGGEITSGVIDEQIRHMVTKASHLHFVICDKYKKNIKKLGESNWRIHNTGALSIDSIKSLKKINHKTILKNINLNQNKPFVILTYHPVTLEFRYSIKDQFNNVIKALKTTEYQVVITSPNIEVGRNEIMDIINKTVKRDKNFVYVKSLGYNFLFNLIPSCEFFIGNSSSGIIEIPYFRKPTINIGDRQKGRYCHTSVINTDYSYQSIKKGITKSLDKKFIRKINKMKFEFGNGNAAEKIIKIIKKTKIDQNFLRKSM